MSGVPKEVKEKAIAIEGSMRKPVIKLDMDRRHVSP